MGKQVQGNTRQSIDAVNCVSVCTEMRSGQLATA